MQIILGNQDEIFLWSLSILLDYAACCFSIGRAQKKYAETNER